MDSTSIDEDLIEEREELMVSSLTEHNIIKKAHFLKPFITTTSIDESEAMLRPPSSPDLKPSSLSVSFRGWRLPNKNFKLWAEKMATLHKPTWIKAGIFEAIMSSTYRINKDQSLILSLAQKWCPETKTFLFPWGEVTITLEDVNVLMGFSISGSSVFAPLESSEMRETVEKLEKQRDKSGVKQISWISSFVDDQIEHEAFLVLWLSNFVFPDRYGHSIMRNVFPIAVRLARGERIALAPAVLATLYSDLDLIRVLASTRKVYLKSLFKLVQLWIWERFKSVRPEAKVIPRGKPRIAQWSGVKERNEGLILLLDDFEWRPYTKPLKNWNPPRFYAEEAKWITIDESLDEESEFVSFARCLRLSKLVGIGIVEDYYPNRVAMQFGFAQDVPVLDTHQNRNFTEKVAWDDYNRSLNGLKVYIPCRLATASVTARYRDWWMKSAPEIKTETFNPSNTVDHYDDGDDDASLKVLPLSQVLEKLGDGTKKKAEHLTNKGHKRARDCRQTQIEEEDDNITIAHVMKSRKKCSDDDVSLKVLPLSQVLEKSGDGTKKATNKGQKRARDTQIEEEDDDDDDNITIAQVMKSRKIPSDDVENDTQGESSRLEADKCSDDLDNTEGERSRLEADNNNVSVLAQNLASGKDETVAATKSVALSSLDDNKNSSDLHEEEDDERLKQRKVAIEELALKLEARMLKVENTLAKIKQWKIKRNNKTQLLA